jgi:hypothetical protein
MAPIVAAIDVDAPAADVFAYATDPTTFFEWQKGVVSGRMDSHDAAALGDLCLTTRKIGFSERESTSELVVLDPPHRWGVRGVDGPIRATVDVTVEPRSDQGSTLTIAVDFEGHGIGRLLVPLVVRREAEKEMPANVAALKQQMESAGGPTQ